MVADISIPIIWRSHSFAYVAQTDVVKGYNHRNATRIWSRWPACTYDDTVAQSSHTLVWVQGYIRVSIHRRQATRDSVHTPGVVPILSTASRRSTVAEKRRKSAKWNPRRSHLRIISQIHLESRPQIFTRRSCQSMVYRNRDNSHN